LDFANVAISFVCGKYCPIIDLLGSKDLSRDLQTTCVISFCFRLYLMLYTCAARFDVTGNLENFLVFRVNKTRALYARAPARLGLKSHQADRCISVRLRFSLESTSHLLFSSFKKLKKNQDFPSHRILRHMYETLNIVKKN